MPQYIYTYVCLYIYSVGYIPQYISCNIFCVIYKLLFLPPTALSFILGALLICLWSPCGYEHHWETMRPGLCALTDTVNSIWNRQQYIADCWDDSLKGSNTLFVGWPADLLSLNGFTQMLTPNPSQTLHLVTTFGFLPLTASGVVLAS